MVIFRAASFGELDTTTLYRLLKLRADVFVVEQKCVYPDLDGRDTEPGTRHLWFERDGKPLAYLRILTEDEPDRPPTTAGGPATGTSPPVAATGRPAARIGRVVTAKEARGLGLASRLMTAAIADIGDRPAVLDAQTYVMRFYERYGFSPSGPEYLDDGIPHLPMRRM